MHFTITWYKKGINLPFKKGSLSDSHYNILDKKASDYIETVRDEREEKDE